MRLSILNKYLVLILAGFLVSSFTCRQAFGQLSESQNSFTKYNDHNLQEKVYVHTDRSFYLCGEIIWFKAYLTNAATNQPLSLSKVVYIEVLDKLNQPVLQGKIEMKNGLGSGSFSIPFSVESGNYKFRAYTNRMKNFSPDYFYEKNISIVNTSKNLDPSIVHESVNYTADFFPEGGNLVNGIESEIAFKVTDNKHQGIECDGIIIDQLNDTVTHLKSLQFGMGHFYLQPDSGKQYSAVINLKDGTSITKKLPESYDGGYVMHVEDSGINNLKISIRAKKLKQNIPSDVYIIIQNNRQINFVYLQHLENDQAVLVLNKDSLKAGVSQITIFDANEQPLCERLYFKRPKNKMLVTAKADKENYQLRNNVLLDISTADQSGISLRANLSAAVYRMDNFHQEEQQNIFSYLWLSSNLRGDIENPDYYFTNENAETNQALDNLLLTQGWRKFHWEKVWQNEAPSFSYIAEYSGHIITGRITNEMTKKPVSNVLVYLSVPGRRVQLKGCISDSEGLVHFDMKDFFGANQIVLQTDNGADSIYRIEIFTPFSEKFSGDSLPALHISESDADDLQAGNFHNEVANAYHEKDLQKLQALSIDTLPFYTKPYKTYLLDNYTRFTTMEEVLREYVAEINVRRKGIKYRLMTFNAPGFALHDIQPIEQMYDNNPLVLLDGVPVFDINKIIEYDPLKVQKLEVVAIRYYWGPIKADGIASFTTYKGNLNGYTLNPHDLVLDYEGLQQQRVFYSPDYSSDNEFQSRLPDFRDLLYWSPEINTNEKGDGQVSFYTGDIPGKYIVVLQGISSNGDAGGAGFILNVVK